MSFKKDSATYTITPMYYGRFPSYEKSTLQMMTGQGVKVDSPSIGFLLKGNNRNIVVDTGPGPQEEMGRLHPTLEIDFPKEANVVAALAAEGLQPQDIDYLIFTHLHWDHCWNGEKFPGKTFYVQKSEVIYALDPLELHANVYEAPKAGMTPAWLRVVQQLKMIDGDVDIDDGLRLLLTPGHTPGGQCVLVNTTDGPCLLAGDTVMQYENWEGNGTQKHLFSAAHVNLLDFDASLKKIEALNAFILPSHDYKVLENKTYPVKGK
ncbi:MAG: N-acyl homoserine lactonase family protein [Synergistaceae bacterium]|nr:N-acyl homoserine lactonase family protein [Synergistaceae bacterium]